MKKLLLSTVILSAALVLVKLFLITLPWEFVFAPMYGILFMFIVYAYLPKKIGPDKLLHSAVSFELMILFSLIPIATYFVAIIVLLIGLGKELIYDKLLGKGRAEYGDMIADIIGIGLAYLILKLM